MTNYYSLFNTVCNIKEKTTTHNSYGDAVETFLYRFKSIKCRLDQAGDQEFKTSASKYVKATHDLFIPIAIQKQINVATMKVEHKSISYEIIQKINAGGANKLGHLKLVRIY